MTAKTQKKINLHEFIRVNSCVIRMYSCLIIVSALLLSSAQTTFAWEEEPRPKTAITNPYSYLPRYIMPQYNERVDRLRNPLVNIAPQTPAIVTDKQGNKSLYHKGKLRANLNRDGTVTYYAKNQKRFQRDEGNLIRSFEYNGPEATIKNELGNILGYERYGLGGKALFGYDSRHNLTNRYEYDNAGYWQINEITKTWKRIELDTPTVERRGGPNGALVAYWQKQGDSLWRVEKTVDANGNSIDGNRTRFDRFGIEYYETFANDGTRVTRYEWVGHRLAYEIDQSNHYKKYNRYGVYEEGFLSPDTGREYVEWSHTWKGTLHIKAEHYVVDPDAPGKVKLDGQIRYYDLNENIERITQIISAEDVARDRAKEEEDRIGWTEEDIGKEYVLQDFLYFYEVKDLSIAQLKALLKTTDQIAESIYNLIQELKADGKADAGLAFVATYDFVYQPQGTKEMYGLNFSSYDKNNLSSAEIKGEDHTAPRPTEDRNDPTYGNYLLEAAQKALERGHITQALGYAKWLLDHYKEKAQEQQQGLNGLPSNPADYAALNLVGQALMLQGDLYKQNNQIEQAKSSYNEVINNFSYSQRQDPQTGQWISLKEECQRKLSQLP